MFVVNNDSQESDAIKRERKRIVMTKESGQMTHRKEESMKKTLILKRHKASDRAYIYLDGRRVYFGKWGKPETVEKYRRFLLDLDKKKSEIVDEPTVADIFVSFLNARANFYVKDGRQTGGLAHFKIAAEFACGLYGTLPANQYGSRALIATREAMVQSGRFSRRYVNKLVGHIRFVFKDAVVSETVAASTLVALQAVPPLQRGKTTARETERVLPVSRETVEATVRQCGAVVAAMIEIQLLTGMRPCEVAKMRPRDLEKTPDGLTIYTLESDKTDYRRAAGNKRHVYLGARAERILTPFLLNAETPDEFLFQPCQGYEDARLKSTKKVGGAFKRAKIKFNDFYTTTSYRRAIRRAARRAGVPEWNPHQLRHLYATEIRAKYGLEAAQIMLGHTRADVTQIYAERDEIRARNIANAES